MTEENMCIPVHLALMERFQFFGIGETTFWGIFLSTVWLSAMFSIYCIGVGIVALLACKIICKKEPLLLDFVYENISSCDKYRG